MKNYTMSLFWDNLGLWNVKNENLIFVHHPRDNWCFQVEFKIYGSIFNELERKKETKKKLEKQQQQCGGWYKWELKPAFAKCPALLQASPM